MRVIAGFLGGRVFDSPRGHRTHPMSEKVRGALFGALGDIKGLTVLDPFSGSGALSIEAVSRGAASAVAVEVDKGAHTVVELNIAKLKINDRVKVTRAYAGAWSTRHQAQLFDLILLDPPFDKLPYRDLDRMPRHLKPDGVLVFCWPTKADLPRYEGFELVQHKLHGDSQLLFYKRK